MAKYQLIDAEVINILKETYQYEAIDAKWRLVIPVMPVKASKSIKYEVSDELPSGSWTTMSTGLTQQQADQAGLTETEIQVICMRRDFSIPWTNVVMARDAGRPLDVQTVIDTKRKVDKDVDKMIWQGGTTQENVSQKGMSSYTGIQSVTDANGNSFATSWSHMRSAYADLIAYGYEPPYALAVHTTMAGYMAHINTNGSATVKEAFTNFLGGESMLEMVITDNLAVDSGDTSYIMFKPDKKNMFVAEVTKGTEVIFHNEGKRYADFTIKGAVIWIGALIIPRPKAITECGGVASA